MDSFADAVYFIENFINDELFIYIADKQLREEKLIKTYFIVKQDIENKINNIEISEDNLDEKLKNVMDSLIFLDAMSIECLITDKLKMFIKAYSLIINNWNANTFQKENISKLSDKLIRFGDNYLTLEELLERYQHLYNRSSRFIDFSPPSFSLSKHYFKIIEKELNNV